MSFSQYPQNPVVGQQYTVGNMVVLWDGTKFVSVLPTDIITSSEVAAAVVSVAASADSATASAAAAAASASVISDIVDDVDAVKAQALADINADVAAVDNSRISSQAAMADDVNDVDASRVTAQAAMASSSAAVDSSTSAALASISTNSNSVTNAANEAISIEIPAQIARLGLEYPPIAYTAGLTLDSNTKTYSNAGALYIWGGALGTVTTGTFNETGWQPIQGDIQLRDDVEQGTSLIRDVKHIASVVALRTQAGRYNGQQISTPSYYAGGTTGGGLFKWDSASTAPDDGGVTIAVAGVAAGRWVRINAPVLSYDNDKFNQVDLNRRLLYRPVDVVSRPPAREDNTGYYDNSVWQMGGKIWTATRTQQSARSSWVRLTNPVSSAGAVITNPAAVWFLSKVVPAYSGPCINVTNVALNTSKDIGFNPDGSLDTAELDRFLVSTTGRINTWYDQSGNNHNLTATGEQRPTITTFDSIGNLRAVVFERGVIYNGTQTPDQRFTIPASLTGNSNNVSFATLCKFSHNTRDIPIIELSSDGGLFTAFGHRSQNGVDSLATYQNNSLRLISGKKPTITPTVCATAISSTSVTTFFNDEAAVTGTSTTAAAFAGGKVGGSSANFVNGLGEAQNGGAMMAGLAVYNKSISVLEYRNFNFACNRDFNLTPQVRGNLICDGDSITEGAFGTFFNSWPMLLQELLPLKSRVFNVAISGGTSATQNTNRIRWQNSAYFANAPYNLVVYSVGTNDIGTGVTADAIFSNVQNYISSLMSTGYDVMLCTVLPRQSFTGTELDNVRLQYNQLLRDNYKNMGVVDLIDFDLEGTMGLTSIAANAAFYADGTHPTPLGLNLIASFVASYVDDYIASNLADS